MDIDASMVARRALQYRRFGEHPIADEMADAAEVASVTPRELRELHMAAVLPRGSTLVLVGDIDVDKAVDEVGSALTDWTSPMLAQPLIALPVITAAPLLLVPKDDAVQSLIRMSAQAVGRTNPRYPAVVLANLCLGGYLASRLSTNLSQHGIGYAFEAHSYVELNACTGSVVIEVDAAGDATADVLNETRYELARLICQPPDEFEVAAALDYALGAMHFGWATQAGLATQLAALAGAGLGMPWLLAFHPSLRDTTQLEITQAAEEFLAPINWTGVVVACPDQFPALSRFCAVTQQLDHGPGGR
jgi:predicted Zn-dependent peptidase